MTDQTSDWRAAKLSQLRAAIVSVAGIEEDVKWHRPSNPAGVPVWEKDGLICTGETYKDKVKLTFAQGARLDDPAGLFNSSLDGNQRRAIDFGRDDPIDTAALTALVRAAAAFNADKAKAKR